MARLNLVLVAGTVVTIAAAVYWYQPVMAKLDVKPWCTNFEGMSGEKLRLYQAKCAWEQPTKPANPAPYVPPTTVYRPEVRTGILTEGIHTPLAKGQYAIVNAWSDGRTNLYAGSLESDGYQGVVLVPTGPAPAPLHAIKTSGHDGALRFTEDHGNLLTLAAGDGATYTFDVKAQTLVRS
jgi:hypothetical protein